MQVQRVYNWPFPEGLKSIQDVVDYLETLYVSLWEDSILRIEELDVTTLGEYNTVLGIDAGRSLTTGTRNTLDGRNAGYSITTGEENVIIGHESGYSITTGNDSVLIGCESGYSITSGVDNVGVGYRSLKATTTADANTALGHVALQKNTTGANNTAVGSSVMMNSTTGANNVGIGKECMRDNTTGSDNTIVGYQAFYENYIGIKNVIVGREAGRGSISGGQGADQNTIIGYRAGFSITDDNDGNVFIGHEAGYSETGSNKLYISNSNTATPLIYGEFDNNLVKITGTLESTGQATLPTINLTGGQIAFPATAAPSADANTLDDYEEGTWTPDLQFGDAKVGITYGIQAGEYIKTGNLVCVTCLFVLDSKGSSNGAAELFGLPFVVKDSNGSYCSGSIMEKNIAFADSIQLYILKNVSQINFYEVTNAGVSTTLTDADFADNSQVAISLCYITE